jgi:hypothetical protein
MRVPRVGNESFFLLWYDALSMKKIEEEYFSKEGLGQVHPPVIISLDDEGDNLDDENLEQDIPVYDGENDLDEEQPDFIDDIDLEEPVALDNV